MEHRQLILKHAFELNEAQEWVDALSEKTKCTYRVTRTYKHLMKRVCYKLDMHCHHFRKKLTQKKLSAQRKKTSKTMLSGVKCKKSQCPSTLKITILQPPKGKVQKYRGTHKAVIKLVFHHNHPIESAHVLGFRPVARQGKHMYTFSPLAILLHLPIIILKRKF